MRKLGQDTEAVADAADAASGRLSALSEALSRLAEAYAYSKILNLLDGVQGPDDSA